MAELKLLKGGSEAAAPLYLYCHSRENVNPVFHFVNFIALLYNTSIKNLKSEEKIISFKLILVL